MKSTILVALFGTVLSAKAQQVRSKIDSYRGLNWQECEQNLFCTDIEVPLDYQQPSKGEAIVPLIKIPAQVNSTDGAYKGMLLFNPGGYGLSGFNFTRDNGRMIQSMLGTNFDLVGFDVRGVGRSVPLADCGGSASQETLRSVPTLPDEYYEQIMDQARKLGQRCEEAIGGNTDAGPHMSSAIVARDMLHIIDAYSKTPEGKAAPGKGRLLNYFGMSYGTYLGQTFASMFPDRVNAMALDAIVSTEAAQVSVSRDAISDLDGAIASFFVYCYHAGPEYCPYYTGTTPMDIWKRFKNSYLQLGDNESTNSQEALTTFKLALIHFSYFPIDTFETLAGVLVALEQSLSTHDLEPWIEETTALFGVSGGDQIGDFPVASMPCPEMKNRWYQKDLSAFQPLLQENKRDSIVGDIFIGFSVLACSGWSINSTEIFPGPFKGETKMPILFASNTYDPVCPQKNSLSATGRFQNAQRLVVDRVGHSFLAAESRCGSLKLREYFQNGRLPETQTFCPTEAGPFGVMLNGTIGENIGQAGLSNLTELMAS